MHGIGSLFIPDQCEIEGRWVRGVREGKCTLIVNGQKIPFDPLNPTEIAKPCDPWEHCYVPNIMAVSFHL
jgi:hypothetical protein